MRETKNSMTLTSQSSRTWTTRWMERNKHLLFADKYGWHTVYCYTLQSLWRAILKMKSKKASLFETRTKQETSVQRIKIFSSIRKKNLLPELKSPSQVALNHVGKLSPPSSQIKGQHVFAAESQDTLPENADPQIPALLCPTVQPTTQTISQTSVCEVTDEQLFIERNLFYSSGEHSATVVKERLRSNLKIGKNIGASTWVIDIIRDGYCFPFLEKPIILHVITTLILFQRNSKYLFLQGL